MSTEQSELMILAIGVGDDFLHVYHNEQDLLADRTIGAGAEEKTGALEFFDSEGYRLAAKYDHDWKLVHFTRTTEPANLDLVRQRVGHCLDHLGSYIESHSEEIASYDMKVGDALALLPTLGEPSEFDTCLKALAVHAEHDGAGMGIQHTTDDPVHNWWHDAW